MYLPSIRIPLKWIIGLILAWFGLLNQAGQPASARCFTDQSVNQPESQAAQEEGPQSTDNSAPAQISFSSQVAKILQDNCVACHSARKAEGGYRLDTFHELSQSGDSGESPIVAQQPDSSLILQRITSGDPSDRMPPESEPLDNLQIDTIRNWIQQGAHFDGSDPKLLLTLVMPPAQYAAPPASYPPMPLTALVFSSDGKQLIAGGYHELTVWDVDSGKLARRIGNMGQRIYALAWREQTDGNSLLAVACGEPGRSGEVRIVDWTSGQVQAVVARSTDVVLDVAFRPGRDELAVAMADQSVRLINYRTSEQLRAYSSHADWVTAIAFSPDGNRLVSASRDKSVKVFDLESSQMLVNYSGHGLPVRGVAFTEDGANVVSVGDDKKLHRWNVADGSKLAEIGLEGEAFRLVRRDKELFVPGAARRVAKIDLSKNQIAALYSGLEDWSLVCAVASDGRVASGGNDGKIKVWSVEGNELTAWLAVPTKH